jgi:hypothetical protein
MKNLIEALKQIQKIAHRHEVQYWLDDPRPMVTRLDAILAITRDALAEFNHPESKPNLNNEAKLASVLRAMIYDASPSVKNRALDILSEYDGQQTPSDAPTVVEDDKSKDYTVVEYANGMRQQVKREPELPALDGRVRLRHDVDRFPHFVAKEGSYGTVIDIDGEYSISIKMDDHIDGCEEWDNSIIWSIDDCEDGQTLAQLVASEIEELTKVPAADWPTENLDGRLADREWPCGMRVRFKNAIVREGVTVAAGTVGTVVWWSPDDASVKLDRTAIMHGNGQIIEWGAWLQQCIWDDVIELHDWESEADAMSKLPK